MHACACAPLLYYPTSKTTATTTPRLQFPLPILRSNPFRVHSNPTRTQPSNDGEEEEEVEEDKVRPTSFDILALRRELEEKENDAVIAVEEEVNKDKGEDENAKGERTRRRQMMRRSGLLAKQVISIQSARSLGFVSQLWVDTASWVVALVEVRPNLLSGEIEKFLLEDIYQVGDVVLVEDDSVIENELKLIGLDCLVGHNVVTSSRRNVGKVRGYTFDINSGAVEFLELDSFGLSILPTSLVSTYCLFVEDVLDIVSDTVIVHENAVSRVQRLTKGIWGTQNMRGIGDMDEYAGFERREPWSVHRRRNQDRNSKRKFHRKVRDLEDDWDLPMDY